VTRRQELNELATNAWDRSHRIRVRRRRIGVVAAAVIAIGAIALPRSTPASQNPDIAVTESPLPTAVPTGVQVLRSFDKFLDLPYRTVPGVPKELNLDPNKADLLVQSPLPRARAAMQQLNGPLLVLAEDGTTRKVEQSILGGAQLQTTSLAPDGRHVALISDNGLLIIDVTTGRLRPLVATSAGQSATRTLIWRNPTTVLVQGQNGALTIDVNTGAVNQFTGLSGTNVVTMQGPKVPVPPVELVPSSPGSGQAARIRYWRAEPASTPAGTATSPAPGGPPPPTGSTQTPAGATPTSTPGQPPATSAAPSPSGTPSNPSDSLVEDRPVFAPPWIGRWGGPGWGTNDMFARSCDPDPLALPADVGIARDAIGAVDVHGLYLRTLVTVESGSAMDPVGFLDSTTVLVSVSRVGRSALLAWDVPNGSVELVTSLSAEARVSAPDLITQP
jgi:hypothetical protein